MSQNSDHFVSGLKASLNFMVPDTEKLYRKKLENWKLTAKQWESALDCVIEHNTDGKLPQLSAIFGELRRQQDIAGVPSNLGWAYFRLHGYDYAIRVKAYMGMWVIADLIWRDWQGVEHHVQEHVGEPVVDWIPAEATDYVLSPDNRARLDAHEIVSREEVREICRKTELAMKQKLAARVL